MRTEGRAFADADGPFLALGASLFWGLWGYQHDRARLERTLQFLAARGVDYVRVLAAVGPSGGWKDRLVDPGSRDYDAAVAGLTDLAYDRFGLRVQWTIFGGIDRTPTPDSRRALVDRILAAVGGREEKVFLLEVANEWWQNGFGGSAGLEELRALARHLQAATTILVAVSHPGGDGSCDTITRVYGGGVGDVITLHIDRSTTGAGGAWAPVGRAWDAWQGCNVGPRAVLSNEPIGPGSSVAEDADPLRLTMAAAVSYLAGFGGYVFHARPGIRGGGAADMARGGPADWWEVADVEATFGGFATIRARLPSDLPNWERHGTSDSSRRPFDAAEAGTPVDVHCASRERAVVCLPIDVSRPLRLVARRPIDGEVFDPLTGALDRRFSLQEGETITLRDRRAFVVSGSWR